MHIYYPDMLMMNGSKMSFEEKISVLREQLASADAVVIGAGSGLSTAAGYTYSGDRFRKYFADFEAKYGFRDMYSGGFYPYETMEEFWGYWCRYIWINRYAPVPSDLYGRLLELVKDKDIVTNIELKKGIFSYPTIEEKVLEDPKVDNMIIFHFANSNFRSFSIKHDTQVPAVFRIYFLTCLYFL